MGTAAFELTPDKIAGLAPKNPTSGAFELTPDKIATDDLINPREIVRRQAAQFGLDPDFVDRLASRESENYHPAVTSGNRLSPKGAIGTMQLMPDTAQHLGVDPYDLRQNISGGLTYLKQQMDEFGDPRLAAAAYNAGPAVVRDFRDGTNTSGKNPNHRVTGGVPPFKETQDYVDAISPEQGQQLELELTPDKIASVEPISKRQPQLGQPTVAPPTDIGKYLKMHPELSQTLQQQGNTAGFLDALNQNADAIQAFAGKQERLNKLEQKAKESQQGAATPHGFEHQVMLTPNEADELAGLRKDKADLIKKNEDALQLERPGDLAALKQIPVGSDARFAAITEYARKYGGLTSDEQQQLGLRTDPFTTLGTDIVTGVSGLGLDIGGGIATELGGTETGTNIASQAARQFQRSQQELQSLRAMGGEKRLGGIPGEVAYTGGRLAPLMVGSAVLGPEVGALGEGLFWGGSGYLERRGQGGTRAEAFEAGAQNLLPMLGARLVGAFIPGTGWLQTGGRMIGNGTLNMALSAAQNGDRRANIMAGLLGMFMGIHGVDDGAVRESVVDPEIERTVNEHLQNPTVDTAEAIKTELQKNGLTEDQSNQFVSNLDSMAPSITSPDVERVRGTTNALHEDETGHQQSVQMGKDLNGKIDEIWTAPEDRSLEHIKEISDNNPNAQVTVVPEARTLPQGSREGRPENDAEDQYYKDHPNERPPGMSPVSNEPAESRNEFNNRVAGPDGLFDRAMQWRDANPDKVLYVGTHNENISVVNGDSEPGDLFRLDRDKDGNFTMEKVDPSSELPPGVYVGRHGRTPWNEAEGESTNAKDVREGQGVGNEPGRTGEEGQGDRGGTDNGVRVGEGQGPTETGRGGGTAQEVTPPPTAEPPTTREEYEEAHRQLAESRRARAQAQSTPATGGGGATEPKQFWEMTRREFRKNQNQPKVDAIQTALREGKKITLTTHLRSTVFKGADDVRLGDDGHVYVRRGKRWDALYDDQVDRLAAQAGVKPPTMAEKVFHHSEVESAVKKGLPVPDKVLDEYPSLRKKAEQRAARVAKKEAEKSQQQRLKPTGPVFKKAESIDSPAQKDLTDAKQKIAEAKDNVQKAQSKVNRAPKDQKADAQNELRLAKAKLNEALDAKRDALTKIEQDAQKQGFTTKRAQKVYEGENKTLLQTIREAGGIKWTENDKGELNRISSKEGGKRGLVSKDGKMALDDMASLMSQRGFRGPNGEELTTNDLLELIDQEIGGKAVYSQFRNQELVDQDLQRQYEEHAARPDSNDTPQFHDDAERLDREFDAPSSPIGRGVGAIIEATDPERAIEEFRERFKDELSPETIDKAIQRAIAAREADISFESFEEGGDGGGTGAPAEDENQLEERKGFFANWGKNNTGTTAEEAEEAYQQWRERNRTNRRSGPISTEDLRNLTTIAKYHIEAGYRSFTDFARQMILELGDDIKPYLRELHARALERMGERPDTPVGIKNAITDAEKAGIDISAQERSFQDVIDRGKQAVDTGRVPAANLAEQIAKNPRPLTPEETAALLYHKTQLLNQEDSIMKEIRQARDDEDINNELDARTRLQIVQDSLDTVREASRKSGYEQGLGLAIRRAMMERDYSLSRMVDRFETAAGRDATDAEKADFEKIRQKMIENDTAEKEYDDRKSKGEGSKSITELRKEAAEARKGKRAQNKEALDNQFAELKQNLKALFGPGGRGDGGGTALGGEKYNPQSGAIDPDLYELPIQAVKILRDMAKNRLAAGMVKADEIVDSITEGVKDILGGVTPRQIRDAISGYGVLKKMSGEKLDVAMRELKRQLQITSKIEDVLGGERPKRSGLQRDPVSPEVRWANKQLAQLMREHGIKMERADVDPEQQQKSALDAIKTNLRNQIYDLDKQIAGEQLPGKDRLKVQYDDETIALMSERNMLRRQLNDPTETNKADIKAKLAVAEQRLRDGDIARRESNFPASIYDDEETKGLRGQLRDINQQIRDARDLPAKLQALEERKAEVQRRIDQSDYSKRQADPQTTRPVAPELAQSRAELKDLNDQLAAGRAEMNRVKGLNDRISELERRIREKDFSRAEKFGPPKPESDAVRNLKAQRDQLNDDYRKLAGPRQLTDAQKIDMAKKATQRQIDQYTQEHDDLQRRIDAKDFSRNQNPQATPPTDPELEALKTQRDAVKAKRDTMQDAYNQLDPDYQGRVDAKKIAALKTRMQNRIDELQKMNQTEKFYTNARGKLVTRQPRVPFAGTDPELDQLRETGRKLQLEAEAKIRKAELENRTLGQKIVDNIVKVRRFLVLMNFTAMEKLTAAGAWRQVTDPVEAATGAALAKIPGLSKIAAKAAREGKFSPSVEAAASALYIRKMLDLGRFWETLKTGKGRLDVLHGGDKGFDIDSNTDKVLGFFNRLHAALKEPVKEAEFMRSTHYRSEQWLKENPGGDITDPKVRDSIAMQAYLDAQRKVFMNDNFVTTAYQNALASLDRHGSLAAKGTALAMRTIFPIVRVPTNYLGEALSYGPGGFAKATPGILKAIFKGVDKLSPDDADAVMRNLQKGLIGTAAMALGSGLVRKGIPTNLGGLYTQGQYSQPKGLKPGDIRIGNVTIPHLYLHHPLLEALQAGATYQHLHGKGRSWDESVMGTGLALGEEQPFLGQMLRTATQATERGHGHPYIGQFVGALVVPPEASRIAGIFDPKHPTGAGTKTLQVMGLESQDAKVRKSKTFWQGVEKELPYWRQFSGGSGPAPKP